MIYRRLSEWLAPERLRGLVERRCPECGTTSEAMS